MVTLDSAFALAALSDAMREICAMKVTAGDSAASRLASGCPGSYPCPTSHAPRKLACNSAYFPVDLCCSVNNFILYNLKINIAFYHICFADRCGGN